MDKSDWNEAIQGTVCDVFEEMAFVFVELVDGDQESWSSDAVKSHLTFSGPYNGHIYFIAEPEFCFNLAANLLGIEPDDEEVATKSFDALGELTNVFGGILMEKLFGNDTVCNLGIPKVDKFSPVDQLDQGAGVWKISFIDDEENRIDTVLALNKD